MNSKTIHVCNWHMRRKYVMEAPELHKVILPEVRDRKGTPKNFRDNVFAELSGGNISRCSICLTTSRHEMGRALQLFSQVLADSSNLSRILADCWGSDFGA